MSLGTAGSARGHRSGRSAAWLARLVRDQEVDRSNPFAPTNLLESATYKMRKSISAPSTRPRCHWRKSICLNQRLFFQFNELHSVPDYEFYFIFRTIRTTTVLLYR